MDEYKNKHTKFQALFTSTFHLNYLIKIISKSTWPNVIEIEHAAMNEAICNSVFSVQPLFLGTIKNQIANDNVKFPKYIIL